jgi:hypothetical protein
MSGVWWFLIGVFCGMALLIVITWAYVLISGSQR